MATSSITKNFIVEGKEQVEKFANAIEEAYQDSLNRGPTPNMNITHLKDPAEIESFVRKTLEHA